MDTKSKQNKNTEWVKAFVAVSYIMQASYRVLKNNPLGLGVLVFLFIVDYELSTFKFMRQ